MLNAQAAGADGNGAAPGAPAAHPVGTIGWQAPELMTHLRAQHTAVPAGPVVETKEGDGLEGSGEATDTDAESGSVGDEEEEDDEEAEEETETEEGATSGGGDSSGRTATRRRTKKPPSVPIPLPAAVSIEKMPPAVDGKKSQQHLARKRTQKCDIFSCGLVYYYVLVPGVHPFGEWYVLWDVVASLCHAEGFCGVTLSLISRPLPCRLCRVVLCVLQVRARGEHHEGAARPGSPGCAPRRPRPP